MILSDLISTIQVARLGLKAVAADDRYTAGQIAEVAGKIDACDRHAFEWQSREKAEAAKDEKPA